MATPKYEVKFLHINPDSMRSKLSEAGATLEHPSRLMRRVVFDWPYRQTDSFVRVREEGGRVSLTYKEYENEREAAVLETTIGDSDTAQEILRRMGATVKSQQESKREEWRLDDCQIMIDEWPWLAPFVEIKGEQQNVKQLAQTLGFSWSDKVEGSVNEAYKGEYDIPKGEHICDEVIIAFQSPLPEWLAALKKEKRLEKTP